MNKKIICLLIAILFLGSATLPNITSISINETESLDGAQCYGFIVPIVKLENESLANDINCRIYHMINDLLREDIIIYWASVNFNASIFEADCFEEKEICFEKGTFIIPFSLDNNTNNKISTIVCDYNISSEIDAGKRAVPAYLLTEEISINVFKLVKVKIARYHGSRTLDAHYLLKLNLVETGFLDFDIITPEDIKCKLNKENFNVMFWPGGNTDIVNINWRKASIEEIIYDVTRSIRKFVNSGGSYFGCCYGSLKASSFSRYHIYKLCYFPLLRLINVFTYLHDNGAHVLCKQKIQDTNHPITYGLNDTIVDFYGGGPKIFFTGKDVKVISEIHEAHENVDGTPSWVTSDFGEGKVVVFTSHPEIVDYFEGISVGKKVIANTLFYTTSKISKGFNLTDSASITSINSIFENTTNIDVGTTEEISIFNTIEDEIKSIINSTIAQKTNLSNILDLIDDNFEDGENENFVKFLNRYIQRIFTNINHSYDIIDEINSTLEKIELVYSLISQNENIQNEINSYKNYCNLKIDEINECISSSKIRSDYVNENINSLINNRVIFKGKIKNNIKKETYEISKTYSSIYVYIVQIYFESLKFLRHNWYDYETSIIN